MTRGSTSSCLVMFVHFRSLLLAKIILWFKAPESMQHICKKLIELVIVIFFNNILNVSNV